MASPAYHVGQVDDGLTKTVWHQANLLLQRYVLASGHNRLAWVADAPGRGPQKACPEQRIRLAVGR
jgi:hypothetical protein